MSPWVLLVLVVAAGAVGAGVVIWLVVKWGNEQPEPQPLRKPTRDELAETLCKRRHPGRRTYQSCPECYLDAGVMMIRIDRDWPDEAV